MEMLVMMIRLETRMSNTNKSMVTPFTQNGFVYLLSGDQGRKGYEQEPPRGRTDRSASCSWLFPVIHNNISPECAMNDRLFQTSYGRHRIIERYV